MVGLLSLSLSLHSLSLSLSLSLLPHHTHTHTPFCAPPFSFALSSLFPHLVCHMPIPYTNVNTISVLLGIFDDDFIEDRRKGLEEFVNK